MTLGTQLTGVMSVHVSTVSMTLHKAGARSTLSSLDADLLFSGVEFGDVHKMAATGALDPKRFPHFGAHHPPCRLNAAAELRPNTVDGRDGRSGGIGGGSGHHRRGVDDNGGDSSEKDSAGERFGAIVGEITGVDCGMSIVFAADAVDILYVTQKVVHYSIWVNVLTILQIRCFLVQMKYSEEGPSAARVSIFCIAMQALMDAYDSFLHLCLGLSSQYMFNTIAVISLFKFILFSLLEARYLLTIWRQRQPDIFNQGWDVVRRELSWLYSRFYGVLVVGLVLLYHNLDRLDSIVVAFQAYWLPQILHDAWHGCKTSVCPVFVCGISITRTLLVLYLWGCPAGIFSGDLYPRLPGSPSTALCVGVVAFQALQVAVMLLQRRWGPRWFVPWLCMPWAYNYHRSSEPVEPGTDCVICMGELDPEDARRVVVTPCSHKFHEACLEQWMDVKMECPTCRATLPPIQ